MLHYCTHEGTIKNQLIYYLVVSLHDMLACKPTYPIMDNAVDIKLIMKTIMESFDPPDLMFITICIFLTSRILHILAKPYGTDVKLDPCLVHLRYIPYLLRSICNITTN